VFFDEHAHCWVGQADLGRSPDGRRHRPKVTGRTKREASQKLNDLRSHVSAGFPAGDGNLTVGQWLEHWLTNILPKNPKIRSQNTIDNYSWAVRKHLIPSLGSQRLRALSVEDIEDMLDIAFKEGNCNSKSSLSRLLLVLDRALRDAMRRKKIAFNPATFAEVPGEPASEGRSLTQDQADLLLRAVGGDRLEALVVTGLMVGLRPGELLGLRWDAVDLDNRILEVRRSLKQEKSGLRLGDPKTPRSNRRVDLPAPVVETLRRHRLRQAEERLAAGPLWKDNDLVFCTSLGTPTDHADLRRAFRRITERAGLGHWHPHELRHSNYSLLAAAGVPMDQIADLQGHRDTRMGDLVYRHRVTSSVDAAVKPMEDMFGRA